MTDSRNDTQIHIYRRADAVYSKYHDGNKCHEIAPAKLLNYKQWRAHMYATTGRKGPDTVENWDAILAAGEIDPECHLLANLVQRAQPEWFHDGSPFAIMSIPLVDNYHFNGEVRYQEHARRLFGIEPDITALREELKANAVSIIRDDDALILMAAEWHFLKGK